MSYALGSATIVPGSKGTFTTINSGILGIIIGNISGYSLSVQLEGGATGKTLYPGTADFFPWFFGFSGVIFWTTTSTVNVQNIPGLTINFDAVGKAENFNSSVYPMSIAVVQAVNPTATGNPIFSANADFSSTATTGQSLNLFNPANSGATFVVHEVIVYTNDAGFPGANLFFFVGADNNYANPVNAISHAVTKTPPVSLAHVTSQDSTTTPPGTVGEVIRCQQFAQNLMPIFPDDNQLFPGGNITLNLAGTASGKIVHLTLKWTELVIVPPIPVTGATAVASQIDSELLTIGTNLIKSVVAGPLTTYSITNDGVGVHSVDQAGVLHQVEKYNSAGNPFQLGQAGDITEVLGQLTVDQLTTIVGNLIASGGINVNTIRDNVTGAQQITLTTAGISILNSLQASLKFFLGGTLGGFQIISGQSVAVAGTSIAHTLGVVPTMVIGILNEGAAGTGVIGWNRGTATSTHFTAFVTPASTCDFLVMG